VRVCPLCANCDALSCELDSTQCRPCCCIHSVMMFTAMSCSCPRAGSQPVQQLCQHSLKLLCLHIFNSTHFSTMVMVVSSNIPTCRNRVLYICHQIKGYRNSITYSIPRSRTESSGVKSKESDTKQAVGGQAQPTWQAQPWPASLLLMVCVAHGRPAESA
jgi:hypothetical protein